MLTNTVLTHRFSPLAPLDVSCRSQIVRLLFAAAANVSPVNKHGKTPLALGGNDPSVVDFFEMAAKAEDARQLIRITDLHPTAEGSLDDEPRRLEDESRQSGLGGFTAREALFSPEILTVLTALDDRLALVLRNGDIRLVHSAWVLVQDPESFRMPHRQALEAMEKSGVSPSPLLSPQEAEALLRCGQRGVGALSQYARWGFQSGTMPYFLCLSLLRLLLPLLTAIRRPSHRVIRSAWLSPRNPDPTGKRMQILRRALEQRSDIEAFFFDFASLYQHPPGGGMRTADQQASFSRAIGVMGDLYASAVGTTVLQIKEVPPRPDEFDGVLCLYNLAEGVDEPKIRATLARYGAIEDCKLGGWPSAIVRFSTHKAAVAAKRAAPLSICDGVDTLYNERSYSGRRGEAGFDDDDGRGWCCFEDSVSLEVTTRLSGYTISRHRSRQSSNILPPNILPRAPHGLRARPALHLQVR